MTTSEFLTELTKLAAAYDASQEADVGINVLPPGSEFWLRWDGEKLVEADDRRRLALLTREGTCMALFDDLEEYGELIEHEKLLTGENLSDELIQRGLISLVQVETLDDLRALMDSLIYGKEGSENGPDGEPA